MKKRKLVVSVVLPVALMNGFIGVPNLSMIPRTVNAASVKSDENIDNWMPSKSLQDSVLNELINKKILPYGSTEKDITQTLLSNISKNQKLQFDLVDNKDISYFNAGLLKGLEYIKNAQIEVVCYSTHESALESISASYIKGQEQGPINRLTRLLYGNKDPLSEVLVYDAITNSPYKVFSTIGKRDISFVDPYSKKFEPIFSGEFKLSKFSDFHIPIAQFIQANLNELGFNPAQYDFQIYKIDDKKTISSDAFNYQEKDGMLYVSFKENAELKNQILSNPKNYMLLIKQRSVKLPSETNSTLVAADAQKFWSIS